MPSTIISELNQISQIALEATPGTPVAATRRLQSLGLPINPQEDIEVIEPPGAKFATQTAINREWSEGEVGDGSGVAYNEIAYPLASLLSLPVVTRIGSQAIDRAASYSPGAFRNTSGTVWKATQTGSGTTAGAAPAFPANPAPGTNVTDGTVTWTAVAPAPLDAWEMIFDIATWNRDTVATYTIETGDRLTGRSYRAAHAFFTGLTLNSARGGSVGISGNLLANAFEDFALTSAGVDEDEIVPATPAHLNVYMDDLHTALGSTLLDGNFSAEVGLGDRANHVWWHGRQRRGPAGRVEVRPDATAELVQADGEEVDDMVAALRKGEKKFFRLEFKGPEIALGLNHLLEWDFSGQIGDNRSLGDEDGVRAVTVPFRVLHSAAWGRAMKARVISTLPALGAVA